MLPDQDADWDDGSVNHAASKDWNSGERSLMSEQSSGVSKGRSAVADVLQQALPHNNRPAAMKLASECIDAWLLASNPVGEPETIYDEFYRLREAARWVVLMWDAEHSMHPAMGELRAVLGLPRERPAREAAEARLDAVVRGEFRWA